MEPAVKLSAGLSKWDIRQKVWDYIEDHNLADFPRPVHHRIPNFKASYQACRSIKELDIFNRASDVKVDPDKPLEGVRLETLQARKTLLVPTPRLRSGLFNKIIPPPGATKDILRVCATSRGVKEHSVPIGLDAKVQVDLVVVGSVAVSEKGWRIGKGEGFADMEYAMMATMGAVGENTVVVTIVHDCQVVDVPEELVADHDLTVDYILTPTRTIKTGCKRTKPQGIIWSKVTQELMQRIPILKNLQYMEKQAGKDVSLKDERPPEDKKKPALVGTIRRDPKPPKSDTRSAHVGQGGMNKKAEVQVDCAVTTVYVCNIPPGVRVSELKSVLRERDASPLRLSWQGSQHRAFLDYRDESTAQRVVASLKGLSIAGSTLFVELSKSQRSRMSGNPCPQQQP
ncbi:methenyltetrahydrofolate synthase domain-containing protein isoform X1 [Rhinatrema bivittatum]|uniref:methenyltetrahydrofolate synthase domain-containing protein isoform X1 n=1 Tax=Rhinatrema bivittatum TaxID=194408 RepID=UPI00112BBD90|nr:methenyltetrahydrofolate synthase domain-containing protein isoform X1 [Rhinatrema bivittatum]